MIRLFDSLTAAEWTWVTAHPDGQNARVLIHYRGLPRGYWTMKDIAISDVAVTGLRREITEGASA